MSKSIPFYQGSVSFSLIGSLAVIVVLTLGLAAGYYLAQQPQDIRQQAAPITEPLYPYESHPNYWPAGTNNWTAKKYTRVPSSPNPGYDLEWVWSGPLTPTPAHQGNRYVIYQPYPNLTPGPYREWESWLGNSTNHSAIVYQYGGPNPDSSKYTFNLQSYCPNTPGTPWPPIALGSDYGFSSESVNNGGCTPHWVSPASPGGYISVHVVDNYAQGTQGRLTMCDTYLPYSNFAKANAICKDSPQAAVVYQRYLSPNSPTPSGYQHGCEATVYAWGYPYSSASNYQNWFRNGELRWSYWKNAGLIPVPTPPKTPNDHAWWDAACNQAWTLEENMVYTGTWKLNNSEFIDNIPIPTFTPIPTITPTPTATRTPTPIPPTPTRTPTPVPPTPTRTPTPTPTRTPTPVPPTPTRTPTPLPPPSLTPTPTFTIDPFPTPTPTRTPTPAPPTPNPTIILTPQPTTPPLGGDLDNDADVDILDFFIRLGQFATHTANIFDYNALLQDFGFTTKQ